MNKYLQVVTSALVGSMARNWRGPRRVNFICLKEVRFSKSRRGNSQCKDLVARQNLVSQRGSKEAAVDGGSRGGRHGNQGACGQVRSDPAEVGWLSQVPDSSLPMEAPSSS